MTILVQNLAKTLSILPVADSGTVREDIAKSGYKVVAERPVHPTDISGNSTYYYQGQEILDYSIAPKSAGLCYAESPLIIIKRQALFL